MTAFVDGPSGPLEHLLLGSGRPCTLFAHGLAGSIDTTRPFASGVPGTRVFLHFRGHGASATPDDDWTYDALAAELTTVAGAVGATQALGVSLGAGTLLRVLVDDPHCFERAAFVLPAVLDRPRAGFGAAGFAALADALDAGDVAGAADLLARQAPDPSAGVVRVWATRQAAALVGTPVSRALRTMPHEAPLREPGERARLAEVTAPCLVLAQEGDELHPASLARELAGLLPDARLVVLPPGGLLWAHRARVRAVVTDFFA